MTFTPYANKNIVDLSQFTRLERGHWTYYSQFQHRTYELKLIQKEDQKFHWRCDCPGARYISHPRGEQCKHEIALARMLKSRYEQKCMAEIEAEQIATEAQEKARQSEVAELRAEVAALRAELAEAREAIQTKPQLAEILSQLAALRAENAEIKRILATKATARKKHQTETEAAQIKEQINTALDDAMQQAENAIHAAQMARAGLADLEAIPHSLKTELDSWTEAGKEELQPDYKPEDHNEPEIKAQIREAQESARTRREATAEERRKMAPLNGNREFSLWK